MDYPTFYRRSGGRIRKTGAARRTVEFSEHSALNAPDQNQQPRKHGREQQTEKGESTDSEPQRQREAIVRNYLKEVREWISTPLEDSESETAFEVRADTPSKNSDASGWPEDQT